VPEPASESAETPLTAVGEKSARFSFELGRLLRQIRTSLGLSRNDVAEGLDWHPMRLGTYERGDRFLTVTQFAVLVDFYNVDPAAVISIAQSRAKADLIQD
jgi:transcriptional regulator with XRE-family HTH domain